jgi:hypothetical protein
LRVLAVSTSSSVREQEDEALRRSPLKLAERYLTRWKCRPYIERQFYKLQVTRVMAEPTGLEPATSDVTGRRSNQLNYDSAFSNFKSYISNRKFEIPIGTVGLEPTTSTL